MPRARLTIDLPETTWVSRISTVHPETSLRVLAALSGDDTGVGLLEIAGPDVEAVVGAMAESDGITDLEVLEAFDEEVLVQFETDQPLLLLSVKESGVPLELPIEIRDGRTALELTASRERLSELVGQLDAFGISYDVAYIRESVEPETLLTPRQRRVLEAAVERGYYDTPRECTLTELAGALDIAKSTASEVLHRAEGKVVRQFVEGTAGGTWTAGE